MQDIKQFYSVHYGDLGFDSNSFLFLENIFLKEQHIYQVEQISNKRPKLSTHLTEMINSCYLQPIHHIERLLHYPVFKAYSKIILGRNIDEFIEVMNLPDVEYPSLEEQKLWKEYTCWKYLQTTVCNYNRCTDSKNKEYIEYQIICEIETENEDSKGIENSWAIYKRYSDFRLLQQQLCKLNTELRNIEFPSRTFLPGRGNSLPVIEQRTLQLNIFLSNVITWLQDKLKEKKQSNNDSEIESNYIDVLKLLDEFLEVSQLDRKPPNKNDKNYSCNMLHSGWFSNLLKNESVSCLYCGYSTVNCEVLAALLKSNHNIHTLDITFSSGGSLRNDGFRCLTQAFANNLTGIKHFYFGGYQGHNCDNEDILHFFESNNTLESFYATGGVSISIDDPLLALAARIPSLVILDLSKCFNKQPKAAQAIVNLIPNIKTHKSLRELYLNENHIGNRGAELLGESLLENTSLQILSLCKCSIGPAGLISLCKSLSNNNYIEKLFITERPSSLAIGAPSSLSVAESIAEMLTKNNKLQELNLTRQYLGEHCNIIINALEHNKTLKSLSLRNNRCFGTAILDRFFQVNQSVEHFDISKNDLLNNDSNSEEIKPIIDNHWASLLGKDKVLKTIGIPYLDSSQSSSSFIEALSINNTITTIEFSNEIQCIKELDLFFTSNKSVKEIINLESPKKGLFSIHSSIASNINLERLHWNNITSIELSKLIEQLSERKQPLEFSFGVKDGEVLSEDIISSLSKIY